VASVKNHIACEPCFFMVGFFDMLTVHNKSSLQ